MLNGKRKRGRGPKTLKYTYKQIADAVGLKPRTVSNHSRDGSFDPEDIVSLVAYINMHTGWDGLPRGQRKHAAVLDDMSFGRAEGMTTSHKEHSENYAKIMDRELAKLDGASYTEAVAVSLDPDGPSGTVFLPKAAFCDECHLKVLAETLVLGYVGLDEKRLCGECKERSDSYGS